MDQPSPEQALDLMPFSKSLGMAFVIVSPEEVRARLDWAPERCTAGDAMHGGALMALADSCGGLCASLNLPDGAAGTTTIESKTNFMRGVTSGHVEATTVPRHVGRTVIVLETTIIDAAGQLVARVTQSQLVLTPRG
jgi:1,4-dihydroxy-2-naphthoyl-CoA hydrolase